MTETVVLFFFTRAGEEKVIGSLVGQVMKESKGKANPSAVQQILREKLAK